jgi:hypothetical protein
VNGIFVVNLAAAWFLTGLIWTIQVVHYPLFGLVGERFCDYEERHMRRIGYVVGPAMLVELAGAILLVWARPVYVSPATAIASLGIVAVIWISTATVQAPCHRLLSHGFDAAIERRLTLSNWIRTIAWTVRAVLLTAALANGLE